MRGICQQIEMGFQACDLKGGYGLFQPAITGFDLLALQSKTTTLHSSCPSPHKLMKGGRNYQSESNHHLSLASLSRDAIKPY